MEYLSFRFFCLVLFGVTLGSIWGLLASVILRESHNAQDWTQAFYMQNMHISTLTYPRDPVLLFFNSIVLLSLEDITYMIFMGLC